MDDVHFPKLFTNRLVLRALEPSDWEEILFLRSDKAVNQFINRPPERQTTNRTQVLEFIERINSEKNTVEWHYWCINLKDYPLTIGTICLWNFTSESESAEFGYDLHPKFQGQGMMSEAIEKEIDFGFHSLNKIRIEVFTHKDNRSSIQLLNRHNFNINSNRRDAKNENNQIFELILKE